ncbi:MAG: c-type cytochrome [Comamonadaceae bacterium]|nr:c-type cytochrome [Comamonadaceae bacterium]
MDKRGVKIVALTLVAISTSCIAVVWIVLSGGFYNVAGNVQHLPPVHSLFEYALQESVRYHAKDIVAPATPEASVMERGAICYQNKCLQCHGGPGVAPNDFAQSMQPLPGPLMDAPQRWHAREIYWITLNGLKMTGMPAWEHRLSEEDLWAVTAFVQKLPSLTPVKFAQLMSHSQAGQRCERTPDGATRAGDIERGKRAFYAYACMGCHTIPGIIFFPDPQVGPPLSGMASRTRIAGVVDNTEAHMVRWLRDPNAVKPGTAMPAMGMTEQDAVDLAAFLASLR